MTGFPSVSPRDFWLRVQMSQPGQQALCGLSSSYVSLIFQCFPRVLWPKPETMTEVPLRRRPFCLLAVNPLSLSSPPSLPGELPYPVVWTVLCPSCVLPQPGHLSDSMSVPASFPTALKAPEVRDQSSLPSASLVLESEPGTRSRCH